jgi:hypothetical protein
MATNTKPLAPSIIAADGDSLAALADITRYAPANPAYTKEALTALQTDADNKAAALAQAEANLKAIRDDAVASA